MRTPHLGAEPLVSSTDDPAWRGTVPAEIDGDRRGDAGTDPRIGRIAVQGPEGLDAYLTTTV